MIAAGPSGHRWVGTDLRVTLGVGPSRPCSPWPVPWPAGQERFGKLLAIRATKPDKNPAQHGRYADQDHPTGLGPRVIAVISQHVLPLDAESAWVPLRRAAVAALRLAAVAVLCLRDQRCLTCRASGQWMHRARRCTSLRRWPRLWYGMCCAGPIP